MKAITLVLLFLSFTSSAFAKANNHCFNAIQKHISEAIEHNKSVTHLYSELSNGESNRLSFTLINLERITKVLVRKIDSESRLYQENGISLLCDELADMKNVPAFQDSLPYELRPVKFYQYDYKNLTTKLNKLLSNDKIDEAYQTIAIDLQNLEKAPYQQCLTRHFLESIARTLKLSDQHREDALKINLPDPLNIIKKFISLQQRALALTNYLDKQAFPLQRDGILIYCQDVPAIEWK